MTDDWQTKARIVANVSILSATTRTITVGTNTKSQVNFTIMSGMDCGGSSIWGAPCKSVW